MLNQKENEMTNYDVVKKLIGNIQPIGAAHIDEERLKNLKETIDLVELLLSDISNVAREASRQEASMKKAGIYAKEYLQAWSEYCNVK